MTDNDMDEMQMRNKSTVKSTGRVILALTPEARDYIKSLEADQKRLEHLEKMFVPCTHTTRNPNGKPELKVDGRYIMPRGKDMTFREVIDSVMKESEGETIE